MTVYDAGCTVPLLCPPVGPNTPFGSARLVVLDALRVYVMIGAVYAVSQCGIAIGKVRSVRQRVSYSGIILTLAYVGVTELEHLGDYAHYRLAVAVLAVSLVGWAMTGASRRVGDWEADDDRDWGARRRPDRD